MGGVAVPPTQRLSSVFLGKLPSFFVRFLNRKIMRNSVVSNATHPLLHHLLLATTAYISNGMRTVEMLPGTADRTTASGHLRPLGLDRVQRRSGRVGDEGYFRI